MTEPNDKRATRPPQFKVPTEPIGTPLTVRGKLAMLGWPSMDSWARAHGYERQMVGYVIRHWGNRTDRRPHGGIARSVMRDLRETLAQGDRPKNLLAENR